MKTTALGVVTIVAAVAGALKAVLSGAQIDWISVSSAVTAGWGLIHAADHK